MTKRQREALKLAMESMKESMKPLVFDANVAMNEPNAPPSMQNRLKRYRELAAAMQVIEEMLRGVQTEMKLYGDGITDDTAAIQALIDGDLKI